MAKPRSPIEGTLAEELYTHFLEFVQTKGGTPIERAFWGWLIYKNKYTREALTENTFRYHFGRLVQEGWIKIDLETRTLSAPHGLEIRLKE